MIQSQPTLCVASIQDATVQDSTRWHIRLHTPGTSGLEVTLEVIFLGDYPLSPFSIRPLTSAANEVPAQQPSELKRWGVGASIVLLLLL